MQERKRGDITGSEHGDLSGDGGFPDWDNPEDYEEDAPEGYYDEDDEGDSYIPGPDDPDYDLSEEAGYAGWEAPRRPGMFPQWIIIVACFLLILAILTPVILQFD
jgi:hypothetical protein